MFETFLCIYILRGQKTNYSLQKPDIQPALIQYNEFTSFDVVNL